MKRASGRVLPVPGSSKGLALQAFIPSTTPGPKSNPEARACQLYRIQALNSQKAYSARSTTFVLQHGTV